MFTYSFVKTVLDTGPIWDDINNSVLVIPTPDSIQNEVLEFNGQVILNPNKVIFTFSSALSGGEESTLNSYMASLDHQATTEQKQLLAGLYTNICYQLIAGLGAMMITSGRNETQINLTLTQAETVFHALNSGLPTVALDRLLGVTVTLLNILTGAWSSGEVQALRQTLQKVLGKTVT